MKMMKLTPDQIKEQLKLAGKSPNASQKDIEVSLDDIESFGNKESMTTMLTDISKYKKMLSERITLINDALSATVPFTRENFYLFCAYTGSGKSTVAANITYPLWKQGKKTLVITNEESQHDVLFRISCLELGLNFNDFKKGLMQNEDIMRVIALFPEISKYVKVLDVNYQDGLTTKVEGIKKALEAVKKEDSYSCVMIDYFQLIKYSIKDSKKTAYENLNDLRVWIGQYIKGSTMPVVMFAQLYSISKKGGAKDIDTRIKDCSAIVEPATVIIEVVPNFESQTSSFVIHKDRFGRAGHKIECGFEKGRYIVLSQEELAQRELRGKLKQQEEKLDKLEAMVGNGKA
jgi:archaellum biogenesis ATPase FlaH